MICIKWGEDMEFLGGLFVGLVIATAIYENTKDKYIKQRKEVERLYSRTDGLLEQYKKAYYDLLSSYNQVASMLEFYKRNNNVQISEDIKEAVKYAMTKSHPDVGGDSEKFIKFKKLYDKYK